jgi:DNA invertase Pin-like site-specific DNA recombinase
MAITFKHATKGDIRRAAAVYRVSTDSQSGDEKDSIPTQRAQAEAMAEREGWDLVAQFDETENKGYQSGRDRLEDRPYIQTMLKAARAGEFEVVVFKNPSRQSREASELLTLARDLREVGVFLAYSDANGRVLDYSDDTDQLLIFLGGWQADVDWGQIHANMAMGRHGLAKRGYWIGGDTPTGYDGVSDGNGKRLAINEDEAAMLRFAFSKVIAGASIEETSLALGDEYPDYVGKKGRKSGKARPGFSDTTVRGWLRNAAYKGDGVPRGVARTKGGPKDTFIIPTPIIIDPETFEKVQTILDRSRRTYRKRNNLPEVGGQKWDYALSRGRILHDHGDGREPVSLFGLYRDGHRRYRCSHSTSKYAKRFEGREGFDPCEGWGLYKGRANKSIPADEVEGLGILKLCEAFESEATLAAVQRQADRQALAIDETATDLATYRRVVAALDDEYDRTTKLFQKGRISEAQADVEFDRIDAEKLEKQARIARLEREAERLSENQATIDELLTMTITLVGIEPDHEEWSEAVRLLRGDARLALNPEVSKGLAPWAVEWLAKMADRFDLKATILADPDEVRGFQVRWDGDEALLGNRQPSSERT